MRAISFALPVVTLALLACPRPTPVDDAGAGLRCPAYSEPTDAGTCMCFQGYTPNLAGTACILDQGGDDGGSPPVDAGLDDAGPDCTPTPYPETDSRAYFEANLLQPTLACASCHVDQGQSPALDESTAYDVMVGFIEPGAATAEDTTAGKLFRVNGASKQGHAFPFSAPEAAATWIGYHLHGVPPEGCD